MALIEARWVRSRSRRSRFSRSLDSWSPRSTTGNARLCGSRAVGLIGFLAKALPNLSAAKPQARLTVTPGVLGVSRATERHDAGEVGEAPRETTGSALRWNRVARPPFFPFAAKRLFPPAAIQPGFTLLYWKESCAPGWFAAFFW